MLLLKEEGKTLQIKIFNNVDVCQVSYEVKYVLVNFFLFHYFSSLTIGLMLYSFCNEHIMGNRVICAIMLHAQSNLGNTYT